MIVAAVILYNALVKVFGTYTKNALLKYSVFAWGVPIIFPLIGVAWSSGTDVPFTDPKTFVLYFTNFY